MSMDQWVVWDVVGEPAIAVAPQTVLKALHAAAGKRIRDLPLGNHSLRLA